MEVFYLYLFSFSVLYIFLSLNFSLQISIFFTSITFSHKNSNKNSNSNKEFELKYIKNKLNFRLILIEFRVNSIVEDFYDYVSHSQLFEWHSIYFFQINSNI